MKYARTRIMVILDEHLSAEGRTLSLCVRDDGPGIPQEECSKVFEPFYQVGNTGNNGSGVGIGLGVKAAAINLEELRKKIEDNAVFDSFNAVK